jgi:hypothetical protein
MNTLTVGKHRAVARCEGMVAAGYFGPGHGAAERAHVTLGTARIGATTLQPKLPGVVETRTAGPLNGERDRALLSNEYRPANRGRGRGAYLAFGSASK